MKTRLITSLLASSAALLTVTVALADEGERNPQTVPDNGLTLLLVGGAVAGLALLRRFLRK